MTLPRSAKTAAPRFKSCGSAVDKLFLLVIASSLLGLSSAALAQDADPDTDPDTDPDASPPAVAEEPLRVAVFDGWTGTATLGASNSTGSAETSSVNGSIRVGKRSGKWAHWFSASVFKGDSAVLAPRRDAEGEFVLDDNGDQVVDIVRGDTSDRLAFSYQPRYFFSGNTYGFLVFDWETDEPTGIDQATRQLIGIGHTFYRDESGYLSAEFGLGNKTLETTDNENFDGAIGFAAANYLYRINENVTFKADVSADFGSDNRLVDASVGIAYKLTETLAFGVSHFIRTNSDVTNASNPLSDRRDSVTTLNLVIDI